MNLDYYKNFVTIVDVGTISAAAERLLIAQPALSKQLQALENYYGAKLVVRLPRHIELTDAGRILYDRVKSICYLEESAQKEIDAAVLGNRGVLHIGITPCSPDSLIETLLQEYHAENPDVTFEIFERNSDVLVELIEQGIIDVAILRSRRFVPPSLHVVLGLKEKIMAYYHKDHPSFSAEQQTVPIKRLHGLPISISNGLQSVFKQACSNAGFVPKVMNVSSSRATSTLWCSDRITVAIIVAPEAFEEEEFRCRMIEGEGLETGRFIAVSAERRLSAVGNGFVKFCEEHPMPGYEYYEME